MPAPVGALSAGRSAPAQGGSPPAAIPQSVRAAVAGAGAHVPPEGLTACYLPLLRELSARLEGPTPSFGLPLSGGVQERQLLTLRQEGDTISITLTGQGKHVRLEESGYLQGLHEVMQPKRGGDHHD